MEKNEILIYTDGCSLGNPGPGGWAAVLIYGSKRKEISGGFRLTTNNRMELLAFIEALKQIKQSNKHLIKLFTDSNYLANAFNLRWINGWKKNYWKKKGKDIPNKDLWVMADEVYRMHLIRIQWVPAHTGIPENERCDKLAKEAASQPDLPIDKGYETRLNPEAELDDKMF